MVISVAPTQRTESMTLVGKKEDWEKLVRKMMTDKGYKALSDTIKQQTNNDNIVQRITLPSAQARQILAYCGIMW